MIPLNQDFPFPNGLFFEEVYRLPETNSLHVGPEAWPQKESGSSSNPRVFHVLCWFQGAIFLRFSESVVDLNSIFPKLGLFVEPYFLGVGPLHWGGGGPP